MGKRRRDPNRESSGLNSRGKGPWESSAMIYFVDFVLLVVVFWLFWWVFHKHHRQLVLQETRTKLFEIRDELWDRANEGMFDKDHAAVDDVEGDARPAGFDDPAYRMIRGTINGAIFALDKLTFWSLVALRQTERSGHLGVIYRKQLHEALEGHDENAQQALGGALEQMNVAVLNMVTRRSIILLASMTVAGLMLRLLHRWQSTRKALLESQAVYDFDGIAKESAPCDCLSRWCDLSDHTGLACAGRHRIDRSDPGAYARPSVSRSQR